ncbi:methyl-viologen-reducing hydrogenase subunit delta [Candidatus Heimdallarchaeota archaeon]|nr:MAG: methyl-viologen-reducing hydrogenase subunit delta [Candidatus Gerdarchaeota archaeon]RLI72909.1 MAG: methyl-viologen-reducing hydrogenase subunit delta [Candidatus Heimdallarchaeota archaeon]
MTTKTIEAETKSGKNSFEPNLLAFCCNWCSYAGADLAGLSRLKVPHNVRIIRTMCSGRVDPQFVIDALENGADGVLIAACHPGDCHYINQNYKTIKRVELIHKLFESIGIEKERLRLAFISAGEGNKFADTITEMVEQLKQLGPNPLNK